MNLFSFAPVVVLCSACSFLYDPSGIEDTADASIDTRVDSTIVDTPPDAMPDAPPDAMPDMMIDGPPPPLDITNTPAAVFEGTGSGNSRPAIVVLDVTGFSGIGTTYAVDPIMDGVVPRTVTIASTLVSTDKAKVALALQIPVLSMTGHGQTKSLHITITQSNSSDVVDVTVTGLDEFAPAAGTVDAATLRPLYSRVTLANAVHFSGTAPALIRSASDITISAIVDANAVGRIAGAHGCDGGTMTTAGGCTPSGGGPGTSGVSGTAGGGGGFGASGNPGAGNNPGGGGSPSGDEMLIDLTTQTGAVGNRGNGGGGGGGATLGTGGAGGGGGGVLELTADGEIMVTTAGRGRANGAGGTPGASGGGHGGGGSGGAVLIRAGAGINAPASWVAAGAGLGAGPASDAGGDGAVGRVRIDSPSSIAGMVATPTPTRGVAWAINAPVLTTSATPSFDLVGDAGRMYGLVINNVAQTPFLAGIGGAATITPTLTAGTNTLCTLATPTALLGKSEAVRCIQVVYVP